MNSSASVLAFLRTNRATLRTALSLALAAWLSFFTASLLHLDHAYWAAMPVWVIFQPSRGLLLERSVFRVIGTLIGAAVGFLLVQLPVPPVVQALLLALWIALNAGMTHILRGTHGYALLLAGMTAAIVVIPSLFASADTFGLARSRVACTLIGVIVGAMVLALLTPGTPVLRFFQEAGTVAADALTYAARLLRRGLPGSDIREERRLVGQLTRLDATARMNVAGSLAGYRRLGELDRLVAGVLWAMAAAQAARHAGALKDDALPAWLDETGRYLRRESDNLPENPAWSPEALADTDARHLLRAVRQIVEADIRLNRSGAAPGLASPRRGVWLAPHREWRLAWRTGALAGLVSLAGAWGGLLLHRPAMGLVSLGMCIFVMVLGAMPLPQQIAPKMFGGICIGVAAAIFYRIMVQPAVSSPAMLLFSIVPFLIAGGLARASARTGPAGVDANMCFLLASQVGAPASPHVAAILADSLALVAAGAIVAGGFIVLPRRPRRLAADAAARIRQDLRRMLESENGNDVSAWRARGARQILRLCLHLSRAKALGQRWPGSLLAALRLGQCILDLQALGMPIDVKARLLALLRGRESPQAVSAAFLYAAAGMREESARQAMKRLAHTVTLAEDLLTFR